MNISVKYRDQYCTVFTCYSLCFLSGIVSEIAAGKEIAIVRGTEIVREIATEIVREIATEIVREIATEIVVEIAIVTDQEGSYILQKLPSSFILPSFQS